jgi:hypothetical protein
LALSLKRIRGALVLGLIWAAVWGAVGMLMEIFVDPHGRIADIWPAVLGFPAFFGGAFFFFVLGYAERSRGFNELSIPRIALWGALAGLMVSALPLLLSTPAGGDWKVVPIIAGPISLLTALSAAGSLAIARSGQERRALDSGADQATAVSRETNRKGE